MTGTLDTDRRRSSIGVDVAKREPIVPEWLRSPTEARALAYYHGRHLFYDARFHGTRLPKYALRWALRSPRGVWRVLAAVALWVSDPDGREEVALVRRTVSQSNRSIPTVVKAREDHHQQMILRLLIILGVLLAGLVTVLYWDPTTNERAYLAVIAVLVLGWIGSFGQTVADAPTSAEVVPRFTPQVVRAALEAVPDNDLARAIKADPDNAIRFLTDPVRAGGGWEILIDLPPGIEAHKVTSRRGALASGLRRPLSTVWPTPDPQAHEGRLRLFVADKPLAQAERPPWTAGQAPELSVFRPQPIGIDERGETVTLTLAYRTGLVSGLPGYGKSYFARQLAATCALDPTCKLWLYDLKGTGDLNVLAPVAHELRTGDDPDDLDALIEGLTWLVESEFPRRADLIASLADTLCPDNKITAETAANPQFDLGPVLIMIDEISTPSESKRHAAEFRRLWPHVVKKGRAVGYMAWGFTQKPDAEAIPTAARDNVTDRGSFRVGSDTASRAALGPLHKQGWRADAMTPDDVGVAIITADAGPTVCRMPAADNVAARQVVARARRAREQSGRLSGLAAGEAPAEGVTPDTDQRTVAELVAAVWPVNNGGRPLPACHGAVLADRLALEWPDRFTGWECADVTGALSADGIEVRSVKYKGRAARGVRWEHLAPVVEYRTERRNQ